MTKKSILELPYPPKELNPNFKRRNHWAAYSDITKKYRADCCLIAKTVPIPKTMKMTVTFYPRDRRMDDDNIIGSFKAGRDGLADGWGINDKDFKFTYVIGEPVKGGKVIVEAMQKEGVSNE